MQRSTFFSSGLFSGRRKRLVLILLGVVVLVACQPRQLPKPGPADPESTGVRGRVFAASGQPAAGAFVYAYRSAGSGLRGPADFAARVTTDGSYFLDLVEGRYHLVARLRQSGADSGPPRSGDAWSIHPGNPLTILPGNIVELDFVLRGGSVPRQARQGSLTSGDTGFSGRLVGPDGQPYSGALALAYRDSDYQRMPDYTSMPADSEGNFTLYVPEPGFYCLAARISKRGQPRQGEPYGQLGHGEEGCREVEKGIIVSVGDITLLPYR